MGSVVSFRAASTRPADASLMQSDNRMALWLSESQTLSSHLFVVQVEDGDLGVHPGTGHVAVVDAGARPAVEPKKAKTSARKAVERMNERTRAVGVKVNIGTCLPPGGSAGQPMQCCIAAVLLKGGSKRPCATCMSLSRSECLQAVGKDRSVPGLSRVLSCRQLVFGFVAEAMPPTQSH